MPIWDVNKEEVITKIADESNPVFSQNGDVLFTTGPAGNISVRNLSDLSELHNRLYCKNSGKTDALSKKKEFSGSRKKQK